MLKIRGHKERCRRELNFNGSKQADIRKKERGMLNVNGSKRGKQVVNGTKQADRRKVVIGRQIYKDKKRGGQRPVNGPIQTDRRKRGRGG